MYVYYLHSKSATDCVGQGVIRHIVIDGIDRNACCGTQVPHLSHCGFIHVIPPSTPSTATKPSSKMPTKLYFTAGPRAIRYLNQSSRTVSLASQAIGVGRDGLVERSAKNEEQRRELISREKEVKSELAKMIGDQAVRLAEEQGGVVWLQRTEKGTHEFDFLSNIATAFSQSELAKGLIIITSTPTATTQSLLLVQSKDTEIAKEFNEKLKSQLEDGEKVRVKGGGAKGRFISKIEGKWGKGEVAKVQRVVEEVGTLFVRLERR